MTDADWSHREARCLGVRVAGELDETNERGERIVGDTLLLLFNAAAEPTRFVLPADGSAGHWEVLIDTADPARAASVEPGGSYAMADRSLVLLRLRPRPPHAR
jgi:glycogen operon protein